MEKSKIYPIFICGFESSGTTLLRRLLSMCPLLDMDLIHEKRQLLNYKTANEALNNYFDEYSSIKSGEKIPYFGNVDFIVEYIDRWRSWWPKSIIFHIVRDCEHVVLSCKKRFNRPGNLVRELHTKETESLANYLEGEPNVYTIPYEALILNPLPNLNKIYQIMGYEADKELLEKILSTREPWEYEGKRMSGLRYKAKVE